MSITAAEFERVFGPESRGETIEERAASSRRIFVRSQIQLAEDNEVAQGHRLSASEAYRLFGWDLLSEIADEGAVTLVSRGDEPASTLRSRRVQLNLTSVQLARSAGVPTEDVEKAEISGTVLPIRILERIAQALALNEHLIGYVAGAWGDKALSVRLREISQSGDAQHFSANDVLALTEAAWVIQRQSELAKILNGETFSSVRNRFQQDGNYSYPAYEKGYFLAAKTRQLLNLGPIQPISNLKDLVEKDLRIPVVQQKLADRFAGATIANGSERGIVVNENGQNSNVWVRRMTIAHEVGHLLWDPDSRLNKLKVDQYDDLESDYLNSSTRDPVEIRANAFAISFLAPPDGVSDIVTHSTNITQAVSDVMSTYGISATAAKFHVKNITERNVSGATRNLPIPSDDWIGRENLTVDWFPIQDTPISRRGRFAYFVTGAFRKGLISSDTGAQYLRANENEFVQNADMIFGIFDN